MSLVISDAFWGPLLQAMSPLQRRDDSNYTSNPYHDSIPRDISETPFVDTVFLAGYNDVEGREVCAQATPSPQLHSLIAWTSANFTFKSNGRFFQPK